MLYQVRLFFRIPQAHHDSAHVYEIPAPSLPEAVQTALMALGDEQPGATHIRSVTAAL